LAVSSCLHSWKGCNGVDLPAYMLFGLHPALSLLLGMLDAVHCVEGQKLNLVIVLAAVHGL
jgi:hypothetical protein